MKLIVHGKMEAPTPKKSHQRNDGSTLTITDQIKRAEKLTFISILHLIPSLKSVCIAIKCQGSRYCDTTTSLFKHSSFYLLVCAFPRCILSSGKWCLEYVNVVFLCMIIIMKITKSEYNRMMLKIVVDALLKNIVLITLILQEC